LRRQFATVIEAYSARYSGEPKLPSPSAGRGAGGDVLCQISPAAAEPSGHLGSDCYRGILSISQYMGLPDTIPISSFRSFATHSGTGPKRSEHTRPA